MIDYLKERIFSRKEDLIVPDADLIDRLNLSAQGQPFIPEIDLRKVLSQDVIQITAEDNSQILYWCNRPGQTVISRSKSKFLADTLTPLKTERASSGLLIVRSGLDQVFDTGSAQVIGSENDKGVGRPHILKAGEYIKYQKPRGRNTVIDYLSTAPIRLLSVGRLGR